MGIEMAILFNEILNHKDVAGSMRVVSAGMAQMVDDGTACAYGGSVSLNTDSRPEDTDIINRSIKFHA